MRSAERFLEWVAEPPEPLAVDSDVVVILAALLCALICVVGLVFVVRCAWLRRAGPSSPPPNKGLKKRALQALPKVSFDRSSSAAAGGRLADCAICLAEFADGDEVRLLPQCGHGFHAGCVDTWLRSHSSCPSCRQVLVVSAPPSRCQRCGASAEVEVSAAAAAAESGSKAREDGGATSFLP